MKIKFLFLVVLCVPFMACDDSKKVPDELLDTYYGMLPCADCPGIYYEMKFNPDFSYSEKRFYLESDMDTIIEHGTYRIKDDSLVILKTPAGETGLYRLKMTNGNLKILTSEGNENTSSLKDYFVLRTTKPVPLKSNANTKTYQKFTATGTEPFWALEIDPDNNMISFKEPEGANIKVPFSNPEVSEGKSIYRPEASPDSIVIVLTEEACQNGMSGEMFSHKVSVSFKTEEMTETKNFSGCGEFSRVRKEAKDIEGKWVLLNLNGKNIADDKKYTPATLEVNLEENEVNGIAGCNQYSGKVKLIEANQITFSQVISTKMACPSLAIEEEFLRAISDRILTYSIKDGKLTLSNPTDSLIFKKAD